MSREQSGKDTKDVTHVREVTEVEKKVDVLVPVLDDPKWKQREKLEGVKVDKGDAVAASAEGEDAEVGHTKEKCNLVPEPLVQRSF